MKEFIAGIFEKLIKALADWADKCLPVYNPNAWNDNNGIQRNNNCYNYGCDIRTDTFAQPGEAHGIYLGSNNLNCNDVLNAAIADGLVVVECDKGCGCSDCHHQVALVIWPGVDYHWYRLDKDGKWSHKPGRTPATNLDNSGNLINDPRTADRGDYTEFCGCFCVNKSKVSII